MRRLVSAIAMAVFAGIALAQAPAWPQRPITLIVPFPPGGSTDTTARILGERMRAPRPTATPLTSGNGTRTSAASSIR